MAIEYENVSAAPFAAGAAEGLGIFVLTVGYPHVRNANRLTEVIDADTHTTTFEYDAGKDKVPATNGTS